METTFDQMEQKELKFLLVDELRRQFRHGETRVVLEEIISDFPTDPFAHASLATSAGALVEIQQAVRKAKATSHFVFYTLTLQGDIATSLEDFILVEATLKDMMDFSMPADLIDIAPELHYLKRIPEGAKISYPERQSGDDACLVEVKGGPFDVTTKIFGLDPMQAIVLAISFARRILTESEAYQRSQLYWIAPDRDLGLL
jgi:hypothetical protein